MLNRFLLGWFLMGTLVTVFALTVDARLVPTILAVKYLPFGWLWIYHQIQGEE